MEFREGTCPKCNGTLQIPKDREKIICMYCGEEIETGVKKQHEECVSRARERIAELLFSIEDPLKDFKKGKYEPAFRAYQEQNRALMDDIEDAYITSREPEQMIAELTETLVSRVNDRMRGMRKRQVEEAIMNYNMCIVVYINPALIDYNKSSGMPFAEELIRQWKVNFPKTDLKISDFEKINAGFKRRFCYITTAVCDSQGKPDDCYELTLLRDYRDSYLMSLPEGEALVEKYYDVAPTIVKHINQQPERKAIYEGIWQKYLSPCIGFIEEHKNEQCRVLYQDMVDTLTAQYFHQEDTNHEQPV